MKTKDKTPFKQINYKKFIEENFMILDRETQIPVPFEFNVVQDKYYEMLKEDQDGKLDGIRDIILKARQQGMSSFILALFAVDFLMRPYSTSICISHRQDSTDFLFKKVKFYLDCYLEKLAVKTNQDIDLLKKKFFKSNSKNLIENNLNGSSFYILTAGAKVGGRGNSARNLLFSEAAFYQDTELVTAEEMIMASAQMVPQGKGMIFVESTANGEGNFYHKTWMKAIAGESSYRDIFFGWQEFYDEEWIEEKKKSFTSEKMFMQEYPQCVVGKTLVSDNSTSEAVKTMLIKENPLKIDNGPQEVVRIETERGYNLECTPYHRFYTGNEYKRLYELQEGDEIALLPASFNQEKQVVSYNAKIPLLKKEVEISDDLARFIGFYMGDGSYYRATVSCVFDKKDKNSIIEMRRLYDKFFGQASERSVGKNKGGVELRLSRTDFQGIFQSLDLIKPYENKKNGFIRKVHVPDYIFKSPKSVIRNFLQGLFDADGFAGYKTPRIVLFNKHLDFLYDIQRLLLMFEVSSSVKTRKAKTGDYNYIAKEIVLTATESQMFAKNIGFISQRKRERTSEWVNKKLGKNAKPLAVSDKIKSIRPLLVKKQNKNIILLMACGLIIHGKRHLLAQAHLSLI